MKYKFPEGTPSVSLLMESIVPVEAIKLTALVNETDLYPKYVPFCKKTILIKELSRSIRVCASHMLFPIIADRETIFVGEGIDRLKENGTIILMARSIDKVPISL